jgi:Holliday junction resolvasome RuvABC endonuclease subunit
VHLEPEGDVKVLALDSAEVTGFAVVACENGTEVLLRHGAVTVKTASDVETAAGGLAREGAHLAVVEEPFVHPRNPATGLVLARLLGRWLQAFETKGVPTATIPASMWQTKVLPGVTWRTRSADRKMAAVTFARATFGVDVSEDVADAIAMATWVVRNSSFKGGLS